MNRYFYIVKKVSTADKNNATHELANGTLGGDAYDLLEYSEPYTFDGSEDYFELLESTSYPPNMATKYDEVAAVLSLPVFQSYGSYSFSEGVSEFTEMYLKEKETADQLKHAILKHFMIEEIPTSGGPVSDRGKAIDEFASMLSILGYNDISLAEELVPTAANLTTTVGTDYSWSDLVDYLNDEIDLHLRKFPR